MKQLTDYQKKFIEQNYSKEKTNYICKKINADYETVKAYVKKKKIKKSFEGMKYKPFYFEKCFEERKELRDYDVFQLLNKTQELEIEEKYLYKSKYGKYHVNQNYFEVIDTEFKAYWLGFLYADGCVTLNNKKGKTQAVLKLTLSSKDKEHLSKFINSIQSDTPIKDKKAKCNGKEYDCSEITICNLKICQDLIAKGCVPKKSNILTFPDETQLPKEMVRHFIRGYFDGDGCAYFNELNRAMSVSFIGTKDFLNSVLDIFQKELKIDKVKLGRKKDNKAFEFQIKNIYACEQIYNYLYKDCNIFMNRKLEKFDKLYLIK